MLLLKLRKFFLKLANKSGRVREVDTASYAIKKTIESLPPTGEVILDASETIELYRERLVARQKAYQEYLHAERMDRESIGN